MTRPSPYPVVTQLDIDLVNAIIREYRQGNDPQREAYAQRLAAAHRLEGYKQGVNVVADLADRCSKR